MFDRILKDLKINVDVDAGKAIAEMGAVNAAADSTNSKFTGLLGLIPAMAQGFEGASGKIAAFDNYLRGLMSLGIAVFFNQLILLAGAAASALLSLASSAAVAGAALGGALVAGVAQALPAVGLLVAAFSRIAAVFAAAKQAQLVQQQQSYMGAKQDKRSADSADAVRGAQEQLADAHRRVTQAQKDLNDARQKGIDKLAELILQERGLSLGMGETQDAIRKAAAAGTGNLDRLFLQRDVTQRQLTTTRTEISQRQDAGPGGSPEVLKAAEGLKDAQRAAANAERGLERAKRGADIADANITAAMGKLNFLMSLMSKAEQHLTHTVENLQNVWRGFSQKATEPLITAFDDALQKITKLLQDPKIINAAKTLAGGMADAFSTIFDHFTSDESLKKIERIMGQAKTSLKPLTDIATSLGDAFLSVAEAAGPALQDLLTWLAQIAGDIAKFFESGRKSGDLQKFFKDGVKDIKAWGDLLWAVIQLFAAIAGPGGGAQSGLKMVRDLAKAIRGWADDIRDPDSKLHAFFQRFFKLGRQMIDALGPIIQSIAREFNRMFSKEGVSSVEGFASFLADVLIPALGDFARVLGKITGEIGKFTRAHPGLTRVAAALLATALTYGILAKLNQVFAPLTKGIKYLVELAVPLEKVGGALRGLFGATTTATGVEAGPLAGLAEAATAAVAPIAVIAIVIGGLLLISGKLDDVWRTIVETGKRIWTGIQPGIESVKKSIGDLVDQFQKGGGLVSVLKWVGSFVADVLMIVIKRFGDSFIDVFNGIAKIVSAFIDVLTGIAMLFHGDIGGALGKFGDAFKKVFSGLKDLVWGEIKFLPSIFVDLAKLIISNLLKGLKGLGKAIADGIVAGLTSVGNVILKFFEDTWDDILKFFEVFSPSGLAKKLGIAIIDGLWAGIKAAGKLMADAAGWVWDKFKDGLRTEIRGFTVIGRWIYNAIRDSLHAVGRFFRDLAGWVWDQIKNQIRREIAGLTAIGRWIWRAIKDGVETVADLYKQVGGWVWDRIKGAIRAEISIWKGIGTWIWNAIKDSVSAVADKFKDVGKTIINAIGDGIKGAPEAILGAVAWVIDKLPLPGFVKGKVKDFLHLDVLQRQEGGPIPGYGGGDRVPAMLEPGEHVWTKEEVARAGGHSALFAMRALFGGGTQASGSGMQEGGAPFGHMQLAQNNPQGFWVAKQQQQQTEEDQKKANRDAEVEAVRTTSERAKKWAEMWEQMKTATRRGANYIESQIRDMRANVNTTMTRMVRDTRGQLDLIVTSFSNHGGKIVASWTKTFNDVTQVTYDGLKYIQDETNQALHALGGKSIHFSLTEPSKNQQASASDVQAGHGFASGGMVGLPGERGGDRVNAWLGRGEAVLNYAHQKVVNSALWNQYGMTLDGLFNRVDARHAGGQGYARGGYTGPGHSGEGFTPVWNMAKDKFGMTSFTGFDGHSQMTSSGNVSDHYVHRALDMSNGVLTAQEDALNAFIKTKIPQTVKQLIWRNVDQFKGYPIPGHEDHVHFAMPDEFAFDGSLMAKILSRAMRGLSIAQLLASAGTGAPAVDHVMRPLVEGKGPLRSIMQRALDKARSATNKFIDAQALKFSGGTDSGPLHDPHVATAGHVSMAQLESLWKGAGGPADKAHLMAAIAMAESGGDPSINYGGGHNSPLGPAGKLASGLWQILGIPSGYDGSKVYDPFENAKMAVAKFNSQGLNAWQVYSRNDYQQYLGRGGFAEPQQFATGGQVHGQEGAPVGIVAHAGEWVLNRLQQARMSNLMGVSSEHLKRILGFGGVMKGAFADGGEVFPSLKSRQKSARKGQYDASDLVADPTDIEGVIREIGLINTALKNLSTKGTIGKQIDRFLKVMDNLTREGGSIDQAFAKIEEQGTKLQRGMDLAAVGLVRRGPSLLRRTATTTGRFGLGGLSGTLGAALAPTQIPDAVEAADATIKMHQAIYKSLSDLRASTEKELADTEEKIAAIKKGGVTKDEKDNYTKLIGTQAKLKKTLDDADAQIATNRQNMYEAQVDRFSKQTEKLLKPSTTAGAAADLGARISQIFGKEDATASFGAQQLTALQDQQKVVQQRLAAAQQKAKKDPRWQTVADDLQKQLGDLSASIADQVHNNLAAGIEAVNADIGRRQTGLDLRRRVSALTGGEKSADLTRGSIDLMGEQIGRLQAQIPGMVAAGDEGLVRQTQEQIAELQTAMVEAGGQVVTEMMDAVNKAAERREAVINFRRRLAQAFGETGVLAGLAQQSILNLQDQLSGMQSALDEAAARGNWEQVAEIQQQMGDLRTTIAESTAQMLRDTMDEIDKQAARRETGLALLGRAADLQERAGDRLGAIRTRQGVSAGRIESLQTTRLADQALLLQTEATQPENVGLIKDLKEKIADLDQTIAEEIQTQNDLIFTYRAATLALITERAGRTTGLIQTASQIMQKAGELIGAVDFPALQRLLTQTGNTLRATAIQIVDTVRDAMSEFGGEGAGILSQLAAAFQSGPNQFASTLAALAPAIARLEEGMSTEQKTAFEAIIQSMIDNTTALLDNTDQLNQITGRNAGQSFSSSLWTIMRAAIFTGGGQILPQFQFPQMQSGGFVHKTGLYNLHAGETVVPAGHNGDSGLTQHLYITNPTEVADPDYIFSVAEFNRSNRRAT